MSNVVEAALSFCLYRNTQDFLEFSDSFLNGSIVVVENYMPIAHLVRRNLISFLLVDNRKIEITIKVKKENNWEEMKVIADIDQNRNLLTWLNLWSATPNNDYAS
jgi:hypothetical protein